jgi:2-polyprenyl-6-hydroxyphenyl methylase/3-demethylubiquinone-9 3-methyltransferase
MRSGSIDAREIEHFSKDAGQWWDENGPFAPLHRLNPARMGYIKEQICRHYDLDQNAMNALSGLSVLDIGCGGGLVSEPLARMGAKVTGIDPDPVAIATAQDHAEISGLAIDYQNKAAEDIKKTYDVVLALEIIEHVAAPEDFVRTCAKLVRPGGLVIFSTLNRTPKSFALGIVAAEYILRWVPRGTHSWRKFIKPSELARAARSAGLKPMDISGMMFHPLKNDFQISKTDIDVNYFLTTGKPA